MRKYKNGKLRVGVLFGGRSSEHEVSLMSARSVMDSLDRTRYEVVAIGITREGQWLTGDAMATLAEGRGSARLATLLPEPATPVLLGLDGEIDQHALSPTEERPSSLSVVSRLDVIIPVLHGTFGEDGTVQGLLELADIPYVGAGVVGSAVGMDKAIFKYVMSANDIPILPWNLVLRHEWQQQPDEIITMLESRLPYPVFTKPANLGSSVGISKCWNRDELTAGLNKAAHFDRRLVVEQGIEAARELEVAVLGNSDPVASVVGEIRPQREFYDYVAKYLAEPGSAEESKLIIPANLDTAQSEAIRDLAVRAYKAIDSAGMGRVDLLMDADSTAVYLNEINTIPGFTSISMYPKLWDATGMPYPELLNRLIDLAIERNKDKNQSATHINLDELKETGEQTVS